MKKRKKKKGKRKDTPHGYKKQKWINNRHGKKLQKFSPMYRAVI